MSYTKEIQKQASNIEYSGGWTGLAGGSEVQLDSVSNESNGAGTLGDINGSGRTVATSAESDAVELQNGVHFQYDKRLDASTTEDPTNGFGSTSGGVVDTGDSGALTKQIRVVDDATNVKDAEGLNLQIYAKSLSTLVSPTTQDRIYVDPVRGKIVVPRPEWWSKCEDLANITSIPDIGTAASLATSGNAVVLTFPSGKFNNSVAISARTAFTYGGIRLSETTPSSGCLSFWVLAESVNKTISSINGIQSFALLIAGLRIDFTNNTNAAFRYFSLGYKDSEYSSYTHGLASGWHHIYVVWDTAKSLTGSKSARAFLDGTERCYLTGDIPEVVNYPLQFTHGSSEQTSAAIDNIKYWPYVPSESPDWEYNSGDGREDALHPMYSSANGYKPVLKVGYFYIATSSTPATLSGVQDNITKTLEDATNIIGASAKFGSAGPLSDDSFSTLVAGVDYEYDKRLDASTTEDATDGFGAVDGGLIDTGVSGDLAAGTAIRIVDGSSGSALNVKNAGGLNLKVYAKNLVALDSPPVDRAYVDPATSKFILPGLIFYSKCESVSNFLSPDRNILGNTPSIVESVSRIQTVSGKFGNGLRIGPATSGIDYYYNLIETDKIPVTMTACILSTWFLFDSTYTYVYFDIGDKRIVFYPASADLTILRRSDNVALAVGTNVLNITPAITYDTWFHLYILVDESNGITGGKSISIKYNGTEKLSYTGSFEMHGNNIRIRVVSVSSGQPAYSAIDNIKIWDSIITEDPSWEYNEGNGRENALHTLYGSASDYAPVLTSPGGVGYYKSGSAGSLVKISV